MGGGSSDAASALLAVDAVLKLHLSRHRLAGIAAALGADVPFFLHGGTALVEGLGEQVTPLPPLAPFFLIVVKPPVGVSTALAYGALDAVADRETGTRDHEIIWLAGMQGVCQRFRARHSARLPRSRTGLFCIELDRRNRRKFQAAPVWQRRGPVLPGFQRSRRPASGGAGRSTRHRQSLGDADAGRDRGMSVNVVVLAGGKNGPEMLAATGVENRALTPLGQTTMLGCVVTALASSASVNRVFVVGPVPPSENYTTVTGGETMLDNLMAGLTAAQAGGDGRVLVSTSDIPFLTPAAVEDFVRQALNSQADLCFSYVPVELCYAKYPQMKRTAIKLREGKLTLGNLFLVNPHFLIAHQETIMQAYAARKSPFQVGRLLGWGLLARFLGAQTLSPALLSVARLEAGVGRLIGGGCRAAGIRSEFPEIGTDIDKPDDVAQARQILGTP